MHWLGNKDIAVKALFALLGISYPLVVYFGLQTFPVSAVLIALIGVLLLRALWLGYRRQWAAARVTLLLTIIVMLVGASRQFAALLLYPVIVSLTLALVFGLTLLYPPSMIERFARRQTPTLDARGVRYTRRLTQIWISFFLVNAGIAAWTVIAGSLEQWTLYNGLVSYLLAGALFFGEWPVRSYLQRRQPLAGAGE